MDASDTFMGEVSCPQTLEKLMARLVYLHGKRKAQHEAHRAKHRRRPTLRSTVRKKVLAVTGKRCHICGGLIDDGQPWQADHVLAYSADGPHSPENYLPAHGLCNHYRWDYLSEEFQWILKMGVWFRTQMQKSSPKSVGREMAEKFFRYERRRENRRKRSGGFAG
jgi:hypothetical protein